MNVIKGSAVILFVANTMFPIPPLPYSSFAFSLMGLVIGIVTDLTYVFIDPRIDFESRG